MKMGKSKVEADAAGYYPAILTGLVAENKATRVKINNQVILITKLDGEYYAFSAFCPHAAGDLSAGLLYKGRVDCPEHEYRFDIRSGRTLWPPDESYRLKTYPLKVEDDMIYVQLVKK